MKIQKNINYFFSNYLLLLTALILVGMYIRSSSIRIPSAFTCWSLFHLLSDENNVIRYWFILFFLLTIFSMSGSSTGISCSWLSPVPFGKFFLRLCFLACSFMWSCRASFLSARNYSEDRIMSLRADNFPCHLLSVILDGAAVEPELEGDYNAYNPKLK